MIYLNIYKYSAPNYIKLPLTEHITDSTDAFSEIHPQLWPSLEIKSTSQNICLRTFSKTFKLCPPSPFFFHFYVCVLMAWWRDLSSFTQLQSRRYQRQGQANKSHAAKLGTFYQALHVVTNKVRANSPPHLKRSACFEEKQNRQKLILRKLSKNNVFFFGGLVSNSLVWSYMKTLSPKKSGRVRLKQ